MDVRLPNLGEGVDSGSVVTLFVKEGDVINKGQTILELENEKAVAPIPSPAQGRVSAIRVKAGDKLSVGQLILVLNEAAAGSPPPPAAQPAQAKAEASSPAARQAPSPTEAPAAEPADRAQLASTKAGFPPPAGPAIRRLAKDLGIDLSRVTGSEHGGRIVMQDLRTYIQGLQQMAARTQKGDRASAPAEAPDFAKWGPVSAKPFSALRQVISRRMSDNWATIPHVTQFDRADLTAITALRKKYAAAYEGKGAKLTVTAFILKAVVRVLKKHPLFNASLDEAAQTIVFKEYFHIGLAVDTEAGLVVPVLHDVDTKSMLQLSLEIQAFAEKARSRKLAADDMKGGTFTISNQGGIGGGPFTPIINKPEVAILGLGRSALQPAVVKDQVVPRLLLPLALSYDHRLIDGGNAARFIVDLVESIEQFSEDLARI